MTPLLRRLARMIEATGPISVADYMGLCLYDPVHGYYTTREPFGVAGDFTTAPEISQMFGELVAVWLYTAWTGSGRPEPVTIAEIGPGRGTLMKDIVRTIARLDKGLVARASFALIETSARLTAIQKQTLAGVPVDPQWHQSIATIAKAPLFIVGNELFDALPIRQFIRTASGWHERLVGLSPEPSRRSSLPGPTKRTLRFVLGSDRLDPSLLPAHAGPAGEGSVIELGPAREALAILIARRIAEDGGAGLFIDYGYERSAIGDTLQAVWRHRFDNVLDRPGQADLTAHVDFESLEACARTAGIDAWLMTQGRFLSAMGLAERAERLSSRASAPARVRIASEVQRLSGPHAMGELFKVLALLPSGLAIPPFAAH